MGHPSLDLSGKIAVVIGGTSGIGLVLARGLAEAGADVVPTGRREDLAATAAKQVKHFDRRSLAFPCDITDVQQIERLCDTVIAEFGAVQILVNCAGRTAYAELPRIGMELDSRNQPQRDPESLPGFRQTYARTWLRSNHRYCFVVVLRRRV